MDGIEGKTAVVTGGATGIGRSIAERLAREGAAVRIFDLVPAVEAVARIRSAGGDAEHFRGDVTVRADIGEALALPDWSPDFLVNVAGVFAWEDVLDPSREDWERTIATDLGGVHNCCRAAIPHMRGRGGGRIVSISSNAAILGFRAMPSYGAAKAGIHGLTRSLAVDLGSFGITVNVVAPGSIATGIGETSGWTSEPSITRWDRTRTPLRRQGRPEDVTGAVAFLVSEDASWITGQTLVVDGGFSINGGPDLEGFRPPA
jgi:NAD(P)-dependent dehydrogenase (short-subunit alcohol dehydrogenase family)